VSIDLISLVPSRTFGLFGAGAIEFSLSEEGLSIDTKSGQQYSIPAESVAISVSYSAGLFFSKLILKTNKGTRRFRGLPKLEAKEVYLWLQRYGVKRLLPLVTESVDQVNGILKNGYLRNSRLQPIRQIALDAVDHFGTVPDSELVPSVDTGVFQFLFDVSGWRAKDIEKFRSQYVQRMQEEYSDFFSSVESNPLTQRQCEACIVDEDNNLVLAGAGTGKTSTMIGRAGFLLKSEQAKPQDILMLAFANKAAAEMQERLEEKLGHSGVVASTFHKLGKDIIASVEGSQPSLSPLAEDDKLLAWQINQWFDARLQERAYLKLVLKYFQEHLYPEANPFDFETEGEYFEYILANEIRTLKGELVKSLGECLIANYLFTQGVEYQYEAPYEHSTRDLDFRQYQPDFFLPEYGIYLEYFGTDRNGNTAPYVDREQYHAGIAWKRALHEEHGTRMIETYHYQRMEGILFDELDRLLGAAGVVYNPLPAEANLETMKEFGAVNALAQLLADLLRRYRANCYEADQLKAVIKLAENSKQMKAAIQLLQPIVEDYNAHLMEQGQIDFDDMIGKAIEYIRTGQFKSPWSFILVDEFQDISEPRARLVQYLKESADECSLYCVGDDWQAIYRFTGSDLSFTTGFEKVFGPTKITALDLTFRFNNSISDIASRFVLETQCK
jgi:DNA helicase-4